MNRNCSLCNIKIDINNYKKDRTVCKICYNRNKRKNNNHTITQNHQHTLSEKEKCFTQHQPKNDNNNDRIHENHAYIITGPRNVGETYYRLEKLKEIGNKRPVHIITRSPNQYPNYKTSNENKTINKNKRSIVIFDDMLGAQNSSQNNDFYTMGRHEGIELFYYISQSYFSLPRQTIRNNSDIKRLFKQTLRDVQLHVL